MAVWNTFAFSMRPAAMTGAVMIAVVTVGNRCRYTPCVSPCCDCKMNLSLVVSIRGIQLLRVSYVSWDPIYERNQFITICHMTLHKYFFWKKTKLTLSTCWQSQRKVDHCNVVLGPMAWCLAFVCDSLSWWCSVDYHVNRRIDDDVMPDLIHPPAVHSIPPLCKPAAQLHFHQEISGSRCIAQLIYILWIFKIGVR